jgi:hypothetical protein
MKPSIRFCSTSSSPVTISKRAMRPSWLSFTRDSFVLFCLTADFLSWLRFDVTVDAPFDQIETAEKKSSARLKTLVSATILIAVPE